jgi:hypothetical protein
VISDTLFREIVQSEHGAAVAYFLGQNAAESKRIAALPPAAQIKEFGKLEARAEAAKPSGPARAITKSNAPKPVPPVGGGAAASTVAPEDEDVDSWMESRNAEERKGRR